MTPALRSPRASAPPRPAIRPTALGAASIFEHFDPRLGRFSLRLVDPDADGRMLHGWLTHPKAQYWPEAGPDVADTIAEYRRIDSSPSHDAFVGLHECEPRFLVERYDPAQDEIGEAYEVCEGDLGMTSSSPPLTGRSTASPARDGDGDVLCVFRRLGAARGRRTGHA